MAKLIPASVIGLRTFANKDKTKWYYIVNVTFEDGETTGLNCANLFVSDTDYATIQACYSDPTFTIQVFRLDRGYGYVM